MEIITTKLGSKHYPKSMKALDMISDIIKTEKRSPWREFHRNWAGVHFKDTDISDGVWNAFFKWKINPKRPYWDSAEDKRLFDDWADGQRKEYESDG